MENQKNEKLNQDPTMPKKSEGQNIPKNAKKSNKKLKLNLKVFKKAEDPNSLLNIKNLKVMFASSRGLIKAVEGIDLEIKKGECAALVGESGCGKSVTSLTIMGLRNEPPCIWKADNMTLNIEGAEVDLSKLTETQLQDIRGRYMSMVFQDPMTCLNPVMRVGAQIDEVFLRHQKESLKKEAKQQKKDKENAEQQLKKDYATKKDSATTEYDLTQVKKWYKAEKAKVEKMPTMTIEQVARNRSIEALRVVNVPSPEKRVKDFPHQLSGGMRQRVMIAMGYACNPSFMIADEPTTALDVTIQAQVLDLMRDLQEKRQTGLLLITHDLSVVANMADTIYVMYAGKIVEKGTCDEILDNPLHPYSIGLIASIPKMKGKHKKFVQIPDMVPHPTQKPMGCFFNPRCKFATEKCKVYMPPLESVDKTTDRQVRCWNYKSLDVEGGE